MTDLRFYHLTRTTLENALPQLLEKTLERGKRAVVMAGSAERAEALNGWLWTYRDRSFLPHGTARDGFAADQPIWLTDQDENPNGAQVLFLTDGAESEDLGHYEICAILFDGNDEDAVSAARARWRDLKAAGHDLTYWQQDEQGRWAQQG